MITPKEYMAQAITTLKKHASEEIALADWALGLGGELGEVASAMLRIKEMQLDGLKPDVSALMEIAKEAGDVLWYVFAISKQLDLQIEESASFDTVRIVPGDAFTQLATLNAHIGIVQEMCKHYIAHKEKFDKEEMQFTLERIIQLLHGTVKAYDMHLGLVAQLNVAKLAHRYQSKKFSTQASQERHEREKAFEGTEIYAEIKARLIS